MMKKKEIFQKIGGIISEINEQYQYLAEDQENLNALELELFIANAHFLSDHIVILQKLIESSVKNPPLVHEDKIQITAPIAHIQTEEEFGNVQIIQNVHETAPISVERQTVSESESKRFEIFEFEHKPVEQLVEQSSYNKSEILVNEAEAKEAELETPTKVEIEETLEITSPADLLDSTEPFIKEVTLPEKPQERPVENISQVTDIPVPTINELLSEQVLQKTLANQFSRQSVKDLKSIISLNDKLLFVKDLFNGYSLAYSEAIELVNGFDNLEAADNFLKINYATKNNWTEKKTTVEKFYEILSRRFTI